MEYLKTMSPKALPHKTLIMPLVAVAIFSVMVSELTPLGAWLVEDGLIHFVAVVFCASALFLLRKKDPADHDYGAFVRFAAIGMALFGLSHVLEYFGETRKMFTDEHTLWLMFSAYFFAVGAIAHGTSSVIVQAAPDFVRRGRTVSFGIGALYVLSSYLVLFGPDSSERSGQMLLAASLVSISVLCVLMLNRVSRVFPALDGFASHIATAVTFVTMSLGFELASAFLEKSGWPEWRVETVMHYFFYAGMLIFMLSFDFLNHLGGIYADLRIAAEKEGVQS